MKFGQQCQRGPGPPGAHRAQLVRPHCSPHWFGTRIALSFHHDAHAHMVTHTHTPQGKLTECMLNRSNIVFSEAVAGWIWHSGVEADCTRGHKYTHLQGPIEIPQDEQLTFSLNLLFCCWSRLGSSSFYWLFRAVQVYINYYSKYTIVVECVARVAACWMMQQIFSWDQNYTSSSSQGLAQTRLVPTHSPGSHPNTRFRSVLWICACVKNKSMKNYLVHLYVWFAITNCKIGNGFIQV